VTPEAARALLCRLGDHLRDLVVDVRATLDDMALVEGETPADTIYAIDAVTDDGLVAWFERHWPEPVEVVSEGLHEPVVVGTGEPRLTVIVDTIDGTRGLMYDKRAAWALAAAGPHGGRLADVVAAAMTEIPTTKQWGADQLSTTRGRGAVVADRVDVLAGGRAPLAVRPSRATDLEHGFGQVAKFFPAGKVALAEVEAAVLAAVGATVVFDDEYLATGGQVHELATGRDRFVADLRPLVTPTLACHPYDICTSLVLEEAGGVVTDPWGDRLDAPLDTITPVAWAGYANRTLAELLGPVLADAVRLLDDA
jgi:fructose-1,6-bisphosphatase/inositol monophosphatase family enzyme